MTTPPPPDRPSFLRRWRLPLAGAVVVLVAAGVVGYLLWQRARLPGPGDPVYEEYVEAFEVGTAALDAGLLPQADENLSRAVGLVPQEPAGWVNRAVLYLRQRRIPEAAADLARAEKLAPDHPAVLKHLALIDAEQGRFAEAVVRLRRAVERDPGDVQALYFLAETIKRLQPETSDAEYQKLMEQILAARPRNPRVLVERLRAAARRGDADAVTDTVARLRQLAPGWTHKDTHTTFAELEKAAAQPGTAAIGPSFPFENMLKAEAGYAQEVAEISAGVGTEGTPLRTFVRLAPPRHTPAAPDPDLTFTPEPIADIPPGRWDIALAAWPSGDGLPGVVVASDAGVARPGKPTTSAFPLAPDGVIQLDINNDFRPDLLLVGPGGLRLYRHDGPADLTDVTAKTGLPADILKGDYAAALAVDTDMDGDIDIILGRRTGRPLHLRNNFDGTFTASEPFPDVDGARAFAWADLDHDGAPDAAMIDVAGSLHVFANERSGQFRRWPVAPPEGRFLALTVADADDDGVLDLIAVRDGGDIVRISDRNKRASWDAGELARWALKPAEYGPGSLRLFSTDLDNNGVPDLIASYHGQSAAWLGSGGGKFEPLAAPLPPNVTAVADLADTGRLDLLALDADGRPVRYRNSGKLNHHWQTIRPRSLPYGQLKGDNRINSFGVGGEMELRTGTHVVKRPITGPAVHFGLGDRKKADVVRIVWPNGAAQIEFPPTPDRPLTVLQRLAGSCPFLFTWNGEKFVFVADFMWSTPLGMYINAQNPGGFTQTAEWVKVRGDQLVPKDGHYEVRVNANLWETHFFDHLALHALDHPAGTEVFADERFALEPFTPSVRVLDTPRPVARAWDHHGRDATAAVRAADGVYLDRAGRGPYQGITEDHWVEVDLGDDAPTTGPVWLVARGWIHPTDSSINFAIEQSTAVRPKPLVLEVPDGKGGWKPVRDKIGFPAGKNKTLLLRLDGLDGPGVSRRVRIRTNLEVFWDALHYARGRDDIPFEKTELAAVAADLRPRGILEMTRANASSPEVPDYDKVATTGQAWRDLIGYHTRFGDIRELVAKVDDRYAILTAGDDVALRFAVPPGPKPGWTRDFVWVSDGWVKDGNLNTRFGKTVLPLPSHAMPAYDTPPGRLEDDLVFRRHRKDWDVFHTRYVTPAAFERGLRPVGRLP